MRPPPRPGTIRALVRLLPLLLALGESAFGAPPPGEGRTVRIGVFPASPLVLVEGGKPDGLFIDLARHFSRELGWNPVYVMGTWSEHLAALEKGEIDLLPAVGYTKARSLIYDFSKDPVYIDSGVVFTKRGTVIHTIFDLQGKRIAALKGSTFTTGFSDFIASFGIECELELTNDNEEVMRRIAEGEAYAGVCIYSLGNELARRFPIVATPISFSPISLEFAVPKGRNGDLLEGIDELMAGMIGDPGSAYGRSFEKWTAGRQPTRIPPWLWAGLAGALAIGALLVAASLFLRREVRIKTERLRSEVAQHEAAEARLTRTLLENETLIRELYHRTKNTLQLIRSFITLEASELEPSAGIERLVQKTKDRIDVVALVHQMLYRSRDLSRISLRDYIADMSALILRSNASDGGKIALDISVDDREVLLDTAIPFGLILNELITNSIKHAFPGGRPGRITIALRSGTDESVRLEYRDDGVGLPEGFDFRGTKTLGMNLLARIVEDQLKGSIEISSGPGLAYAMAFPTNLYEARV